MSRYVRYGTPYESRTQAREGTRSSYMRVHVGKGLILSTTCATLLTAIAMYGW